MLFYIKDLPIDLISPYHMLNKLDNIRSTDIYKELKKDIIENKIKDPILIRNVNGVLQTHVGEQRYLIACELGLKTMKAFVYNEYNKESYIIIKNKNDVKKKFKDITVPTCDVILSYINHGQIQLNKTK